MWDNEQILMRRLALTGCGAVQEAGRWDEPSSLFSAVT